MVKAKGASMRMGSARRPDNFSRNDADMPGPGNYMTTTDTFGKNVKGAATMGSKHKTVVNNTPGPGAYATSNADKLRGSKSSMGKIGTTKRADIWESQTKSAKNQPGPGNYIGSTDTFGKSVKGAATMGSKHREMRNENPGPGHYNNSHTQSMRAIASYGKIGTTKRQDLWSGTDKSVPGPGAHTQSYSSFANTKGSTNFGSGRKEVRNNNPGPGQYQGDRQLTSTKSAAVRIGSTKRPELWQGEAGDVPGPGNYMGDTNTFGKSVKGAATMGSKYKP